MQPKQELIESGPLYPPKPFSDDIALVLSFLIAICYLIPPFNSLRVSGPLKLFPAGILSFWVNRKVKSVPSLDGELFMLAGSLLMHAFGNSYLQQNQNNWSYPAILFSIGWGFFSFLLYMERRSSKIGPFTAAFYTAVMLLTTYSLHLLLPQNYNIPWLPYVLVIYTFIKRVAFILGHFSGVNQIPLGVGSCILADILEALEKNFQVEFVIPLSYLV